MPAKIITTEIGHSLAPEGSHTVTFHLPGWDTSIAFRKGDPEVLVHLRSIYPRFGPFFQARELATAVHKALSLPETHGCLPFLDPVIFPLAKAWAASPHRKPASVRLEPGELVFRVVDVVVVPSVRLYVVVYPLAKTKGIIGIWQNPGIGLSTRLCEALLLKCDEEGEGMRVVESFEADGLSPDLSVGVVDEEGEGGKGVPPPTYLPEGEAHRALRERIVGLLKRDALQEVNVAEGDVFLTPTGMAAIYEVYRAAMEARPGPVVVLGAVFHSTWYLAQEAPHGFKHFGRCDAAGGAMGELEAYLAAERAAGRRVSFLFVEFPSNPILVSVDLRRLRELADEYDFPLVVDETIASFANVDVLPVADVVVSSLTKSFSGYANVMAGAIVLPPNSKHYGTLHDKISAQHHNLLYEADAQVLLANSETYLERTRVLNRNAAALAECVESHIASSSSSSSSSSISASVSSPSGGGGGGSSGGSSGRGKVLAVLYPPQTDTRENYEAFIRRPTKKESSSSSSREKQQQQQQQQQQQSEVPADSQQSQSSQEQPAQNQQQQPAQQQPEPKQDNMKEEEEKEEYIPGYGALLSIDFATKQSAKVFYNNLSFHKGPHLGAHETLAMNFNECIWGEDPEVASYQASFGVRPEQVRIAVGLEDVDTLVDTLRVALVAAEEECC